MKHLPAYAAAPAMFLLLYVFLFLAVGTLSRLWDRKGIWPVILLH